MHRRAVAAGKSDSSCERAEDQADLEALCVFAEAILHDPLPEIPSQTFVHWAVAHGFYELLTAVDGVWAGGSVLRLIMETRRGAPLDAAEQRAWKDSDIDVFVHVSDLYRLGQWADLYGSRFVRVDKEPRSVLFLASTTSPYVLNIVPVKWAPTTVVRHFDIPLCGFAVGADGRLMCTGGALASLVSGTILARPSPGEGPTGIGRDEETGYRDRLVKYAARGFTSVPCPIPNFVPLPAARCFYGQVDEQCMTFVDRWFGTPGHKRARAGAQSLE
jgi:hypothetical protein